MLDTCLESTAFAKTNTSYAKRVLTKAIDPIIGRSGASQVRYFVVSPIAVGMIYLDRNRLTMHQQPRKSVTEVYTVIDADLAISCNGCRSGNFAGKPRVPPLVVHDVWEMIYWTLAPSKYASPAIVMQALADIADIWQSLDSHLILQHRVVGQEAAAFTALPFSAGGIA